MNLNTISKWLVGILVLAAGVLCVVHGVTAHQPVYFFFAVVAAFIAVTGVIFADKGKPDMPPQQVGGTFYFTTLPLWLKITYGVLIVAVVIAFIAVR